MASPGLATCAAPFLQASCSHLVWALKTLTSLSLQEIFTEGVGKQWRDWPDKTLERHRTTAFHSATGRSVRWFSYLSKPSVWIADDLTDSIPRQLRRFYDLVPAVNTNTALV